MNEDMNSGYHGYSMSKRAMEAYENGEMPKSKWTKRAILERIKSFCNEYDLEYNHKIEKMSQAKLFETFITWTSWHHTSRFCIDTDFYGLDEDTAYRLFPEMDERRRQQLFAERQIQEEKKREEALKAKRKEEKRKAAKEAYRKKHGHESNTVAAYVHTFPDNIERRKSKKGNSVIEILKEKDPRNAGVYEAKRSNLTTLKNFDAIDNPQIHPEPQTKKSKKK